MSTFLGFAGVVLLVVFVVFWRKKKKARVAAGDNYKSDANYQKFSEKSKIVAVLCAAALVGSFMMSGNSSSDKTNTTQQEATSSNTSNSSANKNSKEEKNYEDANIDEMLGMVKDNALKAQKTYKGKNLKITGGRLGSIDSDGSYVSIRSMDKSQFDDIHASLKKGDTATEDAVMSLKQGQAVTLYCTVKDVGDVLGYRVTIDKIEAAQ